MENIIGGDLGRRVLGNIRFQAYRLALRRAVPGMEIADFQQDLLADLIHRGRSYDPTRASFATFADRIVGHRVAALCAPTQRALAERQIISLDAPASASREGEGDIPSLCDSVPDEAPPVDDVVIARVDVGRFLDQLSPRLRECCDVLLANSVVEGARAPQACIDPPLTQGQQSFARPLSLPGLASTSGNPPTLRRCRGYVAIKPPPHGSRFGSP